MYAKLYRNVDMYKLPHRHYYCNRLFVILLTLSSFSFPERWLPFLHISFDASHRYLMIYNSERPDDSTPWHKLTSTDAKPNINTSAHALPPPKKKQNKNKRKTRNDRDLVKENIKEKLNVRVGSLCGHQHVSWSRSNNVQGNKNILVSPLWTHHDLQTGTCESHTNPHRRKTLQMFSLWKVF